MILRNDIDRYKELRTMFNNMVSTGQINSPEFRPIWQEMEDIKNRNHGLPPNEMENQADSQASRPKPTNQA